MFASTSKLLKDVLFVVHVRSSTKSYFYFIFLLNISRRLKIQPFNNL